MRLQVLHGAYVSLALPAVAAVPAETANQPLIKFGALLLKTSLTHSAAKTATGRASKGFIEPEARGFNGVHRLLTEYSEITILT